ncbi:hypothetical protein BKA70DRAFT_230509 [Coprinopsis sp. MPI-PUGE-AT-0042]|nr:hypothetical protein BKA70DRAFT_230509 [Coprinopsis sp. MPI-PUGE-AT-0042]
MLHLLFLSTLLMSVAAHSAFFHPSMWGFDVRQEDFPYDNRPVSPLRDFTFQQWWFHNHLSHPPKEGVFFDLPAGKPATAELGCTRGATSFFEGSEGGDVRDGNNPCPGSPTIQFHAKDQEDAAGCGLAITYKSDVNDVRPEDFTIFSVNQTCVWTRFTDFHVPSRMPPCPPEGCICAFFWVPSGNAGRLENYMNGFRCKVSGGEANSAVKIAESKPARRCGGNDPKISERKLPSLGNCTYGAKTPFYWLQAERNNMFEADGMPPQYNDLYGFSDGAQDDIFQDSYVGEIPEPSPGAPIPTLRIFNAQSEPAPPVPSPSPSSSSAPAPSASSTPVSSPVPTTGADPIFIPQKSCRPRFSGLESRSGSGLSRRGEPLPDCGTIGLFGRRIYSMSRRARRGVHPSDASRLWKFW